MDNSEHIQKEENQEKEILYTAYVNHKMEPMNLFAGQGTQQEEQNSGHSGGRRKVASGKLAWARPSLVLCDGLGFGEREAEGGMYVYM